MMRLCLLLTLPIVLCMLGCSGGDGVPANFMPPSCAGRMPKHSKVFRFGQNLHLLDSIFYQ